MVTLAAVLLPLFAGGPSAPVAVQRQGAGTPHVLVVAANPSTPSASLGRSVTGGSPTPGALSATVVPLATPAAPVPAVPATAVPATAVSVPATAAPATAVPATAVSAPATAPVVQLVAAWVGDVEASGLEPGSNWTWTMGDTATMCGPIAGAGTGCTYGAAGLEHTTFTGTPTLALVAHELANAETQNDAVPSLLNEVASAAAGTSWSPTDAVASCLVEHFMGFQDNAAGSWQCPEQLATTVAEHIHDTY